MIVTLRFFLPLAVCIGSGIPFQAKRVYLIFPFPFTAKAAKYGALQGFYGAGYRGMPDDFVIGYVTLLS